MEGDREIEWSWVSSRIPQGPGVALDFGSGGSYLALVAAHRGLSVIALDREPVDWRFTHPRLRFLQGDLFEVPLQSASFDVVINCSTVEHVGLVGRYSVIEPRPDGDIEAMRLLHSILKPGGTMLMTVPVGRDSVFSPVCRVYGPQRLPLLLEGFGISEQAYWTKSGDNLWVESDRDTALSCQPIAGSFSPLETFYSLGCFVLIRARSD